MRTTVNAQVLPECMRVVQDADPCLIVLAFVTQFVPKEIYSFPRHGSIVYHPSLLPLHRGASAINWTIMAGDQRAGFTIFYADDGYDTGDIVLQRGTDIGPDENLSSVYGRFLFPEGVQGMVDAVNQIAAGTAARVPQAHVDRMDPPYYDPQWKVPVRVDWALPAQAVHDIIRGR
jgi:formyltetrahydrofolate dehydrogenase